MRMFVSLSLVAYALGATPALAADGMYRGIPATAPSNANFVTRSTMWHCDDGACTAAHDGQRDLVMCQLLARKVGRLESFAVDGAAMDADALTKCNGHAR
ncbi:hypothetical protein KY084_09115 [Stakelama sp. CBK3Z-3]|uniref:Secreted protein n=1 Tax=Stakelama flava TaxID=2860338 RepID=A0ABS6XLH8_9SPHN|nr:hypothetical protein [Stakelama flava]MBW4331030.1 hypothetical protein [Stakelama flava]